MLERKEMTRVLWHVDRVIYSDHARCVFQFDVLAFLDIAIISWVSKPIDQAAGEQMQLLLSCTWMLGLRCTCYD